VTESQNNGDSASIGKTKTLVVSTLVTIVSLFAIGYATLTILPTDAPVEQLLVIWNRAKPLELIAGILMMSAGMVFIGLRWRSLIPDGEHIPTAGISGIVCAGLLLNQALPGPVGELAAAMMVKARYGVKTTLALAANIHARFIGLAVVGFLAATVWTMSSLPVPPEHQNKLEIATQIITLGAILLTIVSVFPKIIQVISRATFGALGARKSRFSILLKRLDEAFQNIAAGLQVVGTLGYKAYAKASLFALIAHLCVAGGILIGAHALGLTPYPPGILFTYCAATAAVVALIAFPGSQVGWDALLLAFLITTSGLTGIEGFALVVLIRVQQLFLLFVGAGALLVHTRPDTSDSSKS
jgi:hypothetical protein